MVSNISNDKERKEIIDRFEAVSQANLESLSVMASVTEQALNAFSRVQPQLRLIQQMHQRAIQHLQEVNLTTISRTLEHFQTLMRSIEESAFAYQNYVKNVQCAYSESVTQRMVELSEALSLAYANTSLSYGIFIESKPEAQQYVSEDQTQLQAEVEQDIDCLLEKLRPDFVEMRLGAWTTFKSKTPDYLRQSISSMRELLNQVLRELCPGNAHRKDRIRTIMSETGKQSKEVNLIESIASYVDALYCVLSKIEHTVYKDALSVKMALNATEAVLVVLLKTGRTRN